MTKHEIALQITLEAIRKGKLLINSAERDFFMGKQFSEENISKANSIEARTIAAFYNELVSSLQSEKEEL